MKDTQRTVGSIYEAWQRRTLYLTDTKLGSLCLKLDASATASISLSVIAKSSPSLFSQDLFSGIEGSVCVDKKATRWVASSAAVPMMHHLSPPGRRCSLVLLIQHSVPGGAKHRGRDAAGECSAEMCMRGQRSCRRCLRQVMEQSRQGHAWHRLRGKCASCLHSKGATTTQTDTDGGAGIIFLASWCIREEELYK